MSYARQDGWPGEGVGEFPHWTLLYYPSCRSHPFLHVLFKERKQNFFSCSFSEPIFTAAVPDVCTYSSRCVSPGTERGPKGKNMTPLGCLSHQSVCWGPRRKGVEVILPLHHQATWGRCPEVLGGAKVEWNLRKRQRDRVWLKEIKVTRPWLNHLCPKFVSAAVSSSGLAGKGVVSAVTIASLFSLP